MADPATAHTASVIEQASKWIDGRDEYAPQQLFSIGHSGSLNVVTDPFTVSALQRAVDIARKLCRSQRGLTAIIASLSAAEAESVTAVELPARCNPANDEEDREARGTLSPLVRDWLTRDTFEVVLDDLKPWGVTDPAEPHVLYIRHSFATEVGRVFEICGGDSLVAAVHLFFMGVIMAHGLVHLIRIQLARLHVVAPDTPVKVRPADDHLRNTKAGPIHGDAGWDFEEYTLGGQLAMRILDESDEQWRVAGQADGLYISNGFQKNPPARKYCKVRPAVLVTLTAPNQEAIDHALPVINPDDDEPLECPPAGELRHAASLGVGRDEQFEKKHMARRKEEARGVAEAMEVANTHRCGYPFIFGGTTS